jgi:hypothetical protein
MCVCVCVCVCVLRNEKQSSPTWSIVPRLALILLACAVLALWLLLVVALHIRLNIIECFQRGD